MKIAATLFFLITFFPSFAQVEMKTDSIPIRIVKDDFVDVMDLDEPLPTWALNQLEAFRSSFHRTYLVNPTYLLGDFDGDKNEDVAVIVSSLSNDKYGIIYLFRNGKSKVLGAGNKVSDIGDDLSWIDHWELFNQKLTYETTFQGNGDVLGEREVVLNHSAINVRENEGSGGLIYFENEKFKWIHQGD